MERNYIHESELFAILPFMCVKVFVVLTKDASILSSFDLISVNWSLTLFGSRVVPPIHRSHPRVI